MMCEKAIPFSPELFSLEIKNATAPHDFLSTNTLVSEEITFKGTCYKKGLYVIISALEESFTVGSIVLIFVKNEQPNFLVAVRDCTHFNKMGLIKIEASYGLECYHYSAVADYHPLPSYTENGQEFLILKHVPFIE
jgi:hypothetical protein